MPGYRFKTKEEFEREYGPKWRSTINCQWSSSGSMDRFFGLPFINYASQAESCYLRGGTFCMKTAYGNYTISRDMITSRDTLTTSSSSQAININFFTNQYVTV